MTESEIFLFKEDIKQFVKKVYSLILNEYGIYLPEDTKKMIEEFNYDEDIVIDGGGKYSKGPGRWEKETNKLHLSPDLFNETTFKKGLEVEVPLLPIEDIEIKLKNSANENFTGEELANLIRQRKLTYLDITKGVVIHELFHSIIRMKSDEEFFSLEYDGKRFDCRGVKGELLDEGLVEYHARLLANKYDLFLFPSIPYQGNVDYAKQVLEKLGKNAYKIIFSGDYKTVLNYIHEPGVLENYHNKENEWLKTRIADRFKIAEEKDNVYDFEGIEELELV